MQVRGADPRPDRPVGGHAQRFWSRCQAGLGAVTVDLAGLLTSWELHLRAERGSPETVKS